VKKLVNLLRRVDDALRQLVHINAFLSILTYYKITIIWFKQIRNNLIIYLEVARFYNKFTLINLLINFNYT